MSPKFKLNFTNIIASLPEVDAHFQPLVWCPMMVKLKDQNQYRSKGGESVSAITDALNEQGFRGSLKEAYGGRSMQ